MGLTFSKSVKVGAVRFNFSGSGIGISVGIPGLRIGTGLRGAYISGGKGGFRYRKSLGDIRTQTVPAISQVAESSLGASTEAPSPTIVATVEHDIKNVLELADSNSDALLNSINEQRAKANRWPIAAVGMGILFMLVHGVGRSWPSIILWLVFLAFAGFVGWVAWRDKMRKLTVLFYEPDNMAGDQFEKLLSSFHSASDVRKLFSVNATSTYSDTKYTGGASQGLKPGKAIFKVGQAHGVVTNVDVPIMSTGKTTLAFYPDRILAFQGNAVGAIEYPDFSVNSIECKFIETGVVPSDATVVDRTWQYVNKKGGPDKRFKENKQLPICLYNELHLSTPSGLDIIFMGSRNGAFDDMATVLRQVREVGFSTSSPHIGKTST